MGLTLSGELMAGGGRFWELEYCDNALFGTQIK